MGLLNRRIAPLLVAVVTCNLLFLPWLFSISTLQSVLAAGDPVIAVAGDIACDPANSVFNGGSGNPNACRQKFTSDLLVNAGLSAVLALGDVQYFCGGYQAFLQSYDPSWGRVKSITKPVVGNHEYLTSGGTDCTPGNTGAAGYFKYYGAAAGQFGQGWYSFDIGTWHLIALNSNCSDAGGCAPGTPQGDWLNSDLAAHTNFCTLAFWHIPLFSSGGRAAANSQTFWQALYDNNADLILNGHDHIYERFAPQSPSGAPDTARGIREFIVGTGGSDHTTITGVVANSQLRNADTYGVMKLTLHPGSYDWQFVPEAGRSFSDSGSQACHGAVNAIATPTNLPPTATQTATSVPPTATVANTPTDAPPAATATDTAAPTLPTATDTSTPGGPAATATATALPGAATNTPSAATSAATIPSVNATAAPRGTSLALALTPVGTSTTAITGTTATISATLAPASQTIAAATAVALAQVTPSGSGATATPGGASTTNPRAGGCLGLPIGALALFLVWGWRSGFRRR